MNMWGSYAVHASTRIIEQNDMILDPTGLKIE